MTYSKKHNFRVVFFFFCKMREITDASEHLSLKRDDLMNIKIIVISI